MCLDDGKLKTIYQKMSTSLIFRGKIDNLFELVHSKIFREARLHELEFLKKYSLVICNMFTKYPILYSERETLDNQRSTSWCQIIITHHIEVHSLVCNICHYMTQIKAFLSFTFSVMALNEFICVSTTVVWLKENYIIFIHINIYYNITVIMK